MLDKNRKKIDLIWFWNNTKQKKAVNDTFLSRQYADAFFFNIISAKLQIKSLNRRTKVEFVKNRNELLHRLKSKLLH